MNNIIDLRTLANDLTQDISTKYKTSRDRRNIDTIRKIFEFNPIDLSRFSCEDKVLEVFKTYVTLQTDKAILEYIKSKILIKNNIEYTYIKELLPSISSSLYHNVISEIYKYALDLINYENIIPESLNVCIDINFKRTLLYNTTLNFIIGNDLTFPIVYIDKTIEVNIITFNKSENDPDIIIFYPDSFLFTISEYIYQSNSVVLDCYKDKRSNPVSITFIQSETIDE